VAVTVWATRLCRPLTENETERLTAILPPARRERLGRQRVRAKREEALCAYGLLRYALREQFGLSEISSVYLTEKGRPLFSDFPHLFFSVSHTEGAVLAAVAECPVGVDIERIRPVGQRMLQLGETDTPEAFFRDWVRREARGKRTGEGIGPMMRQEPPAAEGEYCHELAVFSGYAACAAAEEAQLPRVRLVPLEDLLRSV